MGSEGAEHKKHRLDVAAGGSVVAELVHKSHQRGDGGIELHILDILGDLLDGAVGLLLVCLGIALAAFETGLGKVPDAVKEALAALDGALLPGSSLFKVAKEHNIGAESIGAEGLDNIVRVDNVTQTLAHLDDGVGCHLAVFLNESLLCRLLAAVLGNKSRLLLLGEVIEAAGVHTQNHTVAGALCVGLGGGYYTDIIEDLMPETGIKEVESGMLHTAVIPVHLMPVLHCLFANKSVGIMGIHIAEEVPAGACPLGHSVGLALGGTTADGAGGVDPVGHLAQRAFAVIGGLIAFNLRQSEGQLLLGQRNPAAAMLAVNKGNGLAPIALA